MNRRNKRTSYYQYEVYLDFMEDNPLMSANKLGRTQDGRKWKELSDQLNKCTVGPTLAPEEWRKRLNDWKNSTRAKYRRSQSSDDKSNSLNTLETRALQIFSAESVYREVPVAPGFKELVEDHEEPEESDQEEQEELEEEEEDEEYEYVAPRELPSRTVINGHSSGKQLRLQGNAQIIYQGAFFPNSSRIQCIICISLILVTNIAPAAQSAPKEPAASYGKKIEQQLKRISDIQEASLHFKIARFKYNNPGFEYVP
ncbi:uncharacterized protein [Drosophila takahashii]|uniref:uncharacterized protein isoform X1 n=1 Tax=Drosophila takahashii TaxID=29030 RepID=UPI001CF7FCA8|nr:uncharacterized protein LOC108069009 isoform X1 [Drosophila takahashii]